jgi:hypothetical protein
MITTPKFANNLLCSNSNSGRAQLAALSLISQSLDALNKPCRIPRNVIVDDNIRAVEVDAFQEHLGRKH